MNTENNGLSEAILTSQKEEEMSENQLQEVREKPLLYQNCISCPDYGKKCNGPKLAAMGTISAVREFHRVMRTERKITLKTIYEAAYPVSESTINAYFSKSDADFKWTTVSCIDNGLTAICGNRIGQPPLDNPCPASSAEIQKELALREQQIHALSDEKTLLEQMLAEAKEKTKKIREEYRADHTNQVGFLRGQVDAKDKKIERQSRAIYALMGILIVAVAALSCYIMWDLGHPEIGLLQW